MTRTEVKMEPLSGGTGVRLETVVGLDEVGWSFRI